MPWLTQIGAPNFGVNAFYFLGKCHGSKLQLFVEAELPDHEQGVDVIGMCAHVKMLLDAPVVTTFHMLVNRMVGKVIALNPKLKHRDVEFLQVTFYSFVDDPSVNHFVAKLSGIVRECKVQLWKSVKVVPPKVVLPFGLSACAAHRCIVQWLFYRFPYRP